MAGKFELKKSDSGKFMFYLKAGNGKVILTSELYRTSRRPRRYRIGQTARRRRCQFRAQNLNPGPTLLRAERRPTPKSSAAVKCTPPLRLEKTELLPSKNMHLTPPWLI